MNRKKILFPLLLACSLLCFSFYFLSGQEEEPLPSPEKTARLVFNSLVKKDYSILAAIEVTQKQASDLILPSQLDPEEKRKAAYLMTEEGIRDMQARSKENFDETIRYLERNDIVPGNITYQNCSYRIEMEKGICTMDLHIHLLAGKKELEVTCRNLVKADNSWRHTGRLSYNKRVNMEEMESRARAIADSIAAALQQAMDDVPARKNK